MLVDHDPRVLVDLKPGGDKQELVKRIATVCLKEMTAQQSDLSLNRFFSILNSHSVYNV